MYKPTVAGEKGNKVPSTCGGISGNHLGPRPLKVSYMMYSIKKIMKHTKKQEKNNPLSRDKEINRRRLRDEQDVGILIEGI